LRIDPAVAPDKPGRVETELLDEVFDIEKSARELLDAERAGAARWLDEQTRTIEQDTASAIAAMNATAADDDVRARERAASEAGEIVRAAQALAERAARLDDERLTAIVRSHLAALLPRRTP
jgi:hypothetical protein